jgi:prophage antirepressor-like protein
MNELKVFNNKEFGDVRIVDVDGSPWFVAKDICDVLGYSNSRDAIEVLDADEKNSVVFNDGIPGNPNKSIINESGLYTLVIRSNKPNAKEFRRWVTHEVLPTIRKTGGYVQENRAIEFVNAWLPNLDNTTKGVIAGVIEENRKLVVKVDTLIEKYEDPTYITVRSIDWSKYTKAPNYGKIGKALVTLSKREGVQIKNIADVKYGRINLYHKDIVRMYKDLLDERFNRINYLFRD